MFDNLTAAAVADPMLFAAKLMTLTGVVGLLVHLIHARCRTLIHDWASRGGWRIVGLRRCLVASPFAFVPGMPVYRVTLTSASGKTREAYVRVGNMVMSVLSDELAVEWQG